MQLVKHREEPLNCGSGRCMEGKGQMDKKAVFSKKFLCDYSESGPLFSFLSFTLKFHIRDSCLFLFFLDSSLMKTYL